MKTYGDILAGLKAGLWPDAAKGKAPLFMWGDPNADRLTDDDPDDAIEAEVEKYLTEVEKWTAMVAAGWEAKDAPEWSDPETVTVAVYRRRVLPENFANPKDVAFHALEDLFDYTDPNEPHDPEPTPAMLEAARVFLAVVREEFPVWACDEVQEFEIDVADWRERTGR